MSPPIHSSQGHLQLLPEGKISRSNWWKHFLQREMQPKKEKVILNFSTRWILVSWFECSQALIFILQWESLLKKKKPYVETSVMFSITFRLLEMRGWELSPCTPWGYTFPQHLSSGVSTRPWTWGGEDFLFPPWNCKLVIVILNRERRNVPKDCQ